MTRKIAARLSMLGLPSGGACGADSCSAWRSSCQLLKPIVALTRSRRISRAVSGSPFRNNVRPRLAAPCERGITIDPLERPFCLKSRVSASRCHLFALPGDGFPTLICAFLRALYPQQGLGLIDIRAAGRA